MRSFKGLQPSLALQGFHPFIPSNGGIRTRDTVKRVAPALVVPRTGFRRIHSDTIGYIWTQIDPWTLEKPLTYFWIRWNTIRDVWIRLDTFGYVRIPLDTFGYVWIQIRSSKDPKAIIRLALTREPSFALR